MTTSLIRAASGPAGRSAPPRVARNAPAPAPPRDSRQRAALLRRNARPERLRARHVLRPRHRPCLRPTGPSPNSRAVRRRQRGPRQDRFLRPPRRAHHARPRPRRASRSGRLRARSRPRPRPPGRARRRPSPTPRERRPATLASADRRLPRRLRDSRPRPLPRRPLGPCRGRPLRAAAARLSLASLPLRLVAGARRAPCRSPVRPRPSRPLRSSGRA